MKKINTSIDEQILRASKEIVVKFIEVGRVSPSSFGESFRDIYLAIDATVKGAQAEEGEASDAVASQPAPPVA